MQRLTPSIPADRLYPRNAAFMARTDMQQTRLMEFEPINLDGVTNICLGLMNGLSTVRHRAGVTDEILDLFARAGLPVEENLHAYNTGEEAFAFADKLVADGKKLFFLYPLPDGRFPASGQLISNELWARLNSKGLLQELVPAEHLAPRRLCAFNMLSAFEKPVFVKDASLEATGGGWAIRAALTPEQWDQALKDLGRLGVQQAVVEDALAIERCWCVCMVIDADGVTYGGAAEQTFATPGQQSGNMVDPENPLPPDGVALALAIGERARQRGFIGVAGVDIGRTDDGRLICFDPNFRINSSSSQSLLHASASARVGLPVSYSMHTETTLPFVDAAVRLHGPISDGWFVPTRFIDAAQHQHANGRSACGGFVLAETPEAAKARSEALAAALKG